MFFPRPLRTTAVQLPLSMLLIDNDHFKEYNDHYGHLAGDGCLQRVAAQLAQELRRSHDLVARYGGEEFACLLPECGLDGAKARAEALRQSVASLAIPHAGAVPASMMSISIGVACMLPSDEHAPSHLVNLADQQLYNAKAQERNRVCG